MGPAFWAASSVNAQSAGPKRGLTFQAVPFGNNGSSTNTALASCGQTHAGSWQCDPIIGDTLCSEALPLLCILDIDAPVPALLDRTRYWSGGVLAKSDPVRGSDLPTIRQAHALCTRTFGPGWRVASYHDGGGSMIEGYGMLLNGRTNPAQSNMWLDIKNKPEATCWSR